jgi:hypothetical protein
MLLDWFSKKLMQYFNKQDRPLILSFLAGIIITPIQSIYKGNASYYERLAQEQLMVSAKLDLTAELLAKRCRKSKFFNTFLHYRKGFRK